MSGTDFADILTSLYNGKRSEAVQTAETINSYDISEDWNRQKQQRIYYELVNCKRHNAQKANVNIVQ